MIQFRPKPGNTKTTLVIGVTIAFAANLAIMMFVTRIFQSAFNWFAPQVGLAPMPLGVAASIMVLGWFVADSIKGK